MYLDGSRMLHERACAIGVTNQMYTFNNAQHVPYISNAAYMDSTERFIRDFLVDVMGCTQTTLLAANEMQEQAILYPTSYCNGSPSNEICGSNGLAEQTPELQINVYPNPSDGMVSVEANDLLSSIKIFGLDGKTLKLTSTPPTFHHDIYLDTLPNGIYMLEVETINHHTTRTKIQLLR
jgi:hypothetical protein